MKREKFCIITILLTLTALLFTGGFLRADEDEEILPITLMGSAPRLEEAVKKGDAITIREILEKEPEKINSRNAEGKTPLHLAVETAPDELLAVNEAVEDLAREDPTKAELVKLRFFAGLSLPEASQALGLSLATAKRSWAFSRAWLYRRLSQAE